MKSKAIKDRQLIRAKVLRLPSLEAGALKELENSFNLEKMLPAISLIRCIIGAGKTFRKNNGSKYRGEFEEIDKDIEGPFELKERYHALYFISMKIEC